MNKEDYNKYYIQGSDHYLIPKYVFIELFNEMVNWREDTKKLKEVIDKLKMRISARIKEYQKKIDNEIDMGSQGDHFKICRYEENIKFLKDILKEVE